MTPAFSGAPAEIKEAITRPCPDNERKAWEAIVPLVFKLKEFYEFSLKLECIVPKILTKLCAKHPLSTG